MANLWEILTGSIFIWGILAWLLLFVFKFPKKAILKNKRWDFIALLVIGLFVTGIFSFATIGNLFATTPTTTPTGAVTSPTGVTCQQPGGSNTNSVLVDARNKLASGFADYMTNTVVLVYDDGGESDSAALTGGVKSYTTFNAAPCKTGFVYGLGSATQNSWRGKFDSYSLTKNFDFLGTNQSDVDLSARDTAFAVLYTQSGRGTTANTTTQTMGSGGTLTFYLDAYANETGSGQFGSDDGMVIISADIEDLTVISKDGVSITGNGLEKVACTSYPNLEGANSADVCWKSPVLKSNAGLYRYSITIKADVGDPTATSDDVVFYFDDVQHARDIDGSIKMLAKDSASADVGGTRSELRVNLA